MMRKSWAPRLLLAAPGFALAVGAAVLVLEGPDADRVLNAALAGVGVVLLWMVAVAVQFRYPRRPLGTLMFVLALAYALQTMVASPHPWLFTVARVVRPAIELLLIWLMLAFPSGRLQGELDRALVLAGAIAVVSLWLPGVMLAQRIPLPGPFVLCSIDCPRNMLMLADEPTWSLGLVSAFRIVGLLILGSAVGILFWRFRRASALMRRALIPVLLASVARMLSIMVFLLTDRFGLALTLSFWAVPLAISVGLLRGRLYMAVVLQRLVGGLRTRPDVHALREVIAQALGDPSLQIAYWIKAEQHWADHKGAALALPVAGAPGGLAQSVTIVRTADALPVAALIHDPALHEEPMLVDAVSSSMLLALESHRMSAELGVSRAGVASAVAKERHRLERDLHDGAQQRLIALRMKLGVTAHVLESNPRRAAALVAELGTDVEAAIKELRELAHGMTPAALVQSGLAEALKDVALRAPFKTIVQIDTTERFEADVESAIYFCCQEALQNVAKHAGVGVAAQIVLDLKDGRLEFVVQDSGVGMAELIEVRASQGLSNMQERMREVGGTLEVSAVAGKGFMVRGTIDLNAVKDAGVSA